MATKKGTCKRLQRSYTVTEKLDAIKRVKDLSGNLSAASRELGIDRKRLREWCSKESELTNMTDKKRKRKIGGGRSPMHVELETRLLEWVINQRKENLIVNYRLLRLQAFMIMATEKNTENNDFQCSDKWISNFMRRNNLSVRKITHMGQADNKATNDEVAQNYRDDIPDLTISVNSNQSYNIDETPVYIDIDYVENEDIQAYHCGSSHGRVKQECVSPVDAMSSSDTPSVENENIEASHCVLGCVVKQECVTPEMSMPSRDTPSVRNKNIEASHCVIKQECVTPEEAMSSRDTPSVSEGLLRDFK